jgi:PAS domain S-box-containing protein
MLSRHFGLVAVATLAAVFIANLQLSVGYSVNNLYLAPLLLAIWAPNPRSAYWVAALATVLIAAHTATAPVPVSMGAAMFSRGVLALSLWLTAFVIVRYRTNEDMRQRTELALRRSDKSLEDIHYALDQFAIVATTNEVGEISYVNEKFCEVSKYTRSEVLGRDHRFLNSGTHARAFFAEMYREIRTGRVWRGDIRNRAKDGTLYWVDTTIVPVLDEGRQPHQYIAIGYDITERKRSEAALRDQEALAHLGKMAAVVAHEVRNPLAGIRGAIQMIGRRLGIGAPERGVINEAVARIDTLNGIVEDLLVFARPSKPSIMPIPVAEVIANTIALFKQDPRTTSVAVRIDPTELIVNADAEHLKIVLLNLVMNSAAAMQGEGEIAITARRLGKCSEIRVADDGPGIPPEIQEHLFEPFFTTGSRGTGLGLVTARRLMEAHGGSITLECPPGKGTVAVVRLPAP